MDTFDKNTVKTEAFRLGPLYTNCYIVYAGEDAVIIDPARDSEKLTDFTEKNALCVRAVLLTHGHFDHTLGAAALSERFKCPVYIGEGDAEAAKDPLKNGLALFCIAKKELPADFEELADGDCLEEGSMKIRTLATPGHSSGSVTYDIGGALYCGDLIFNESVGRTDMYGGDAISLKQSIEKLYDMYGDDTPLYCGHGPSTTIGHEKMYNPYVSGR